MLLIWLPAETEEAAEEKPQEGSINRGMPLLGNEFPTFIIFGTAFLLKFSFIYDIGVNCFSLSESVICVTFIVVMINIKRFYIMILYMI